MDEGETDPDASTDRATAADLSKEESAPDETEPMERTSEETEPKESASTFEEHEEYNPQTNSWRTLPSPEISRHGAAFGTIGDVIYVAAGGPAAGSSFTNSTEAFMF